MTALRVVLLVTGAVLATGVYAAKPTRAPVASDWRRIATPADIVRLRDWREAFVKALAEARAGGSADDLEREGRLLDPDAAVDGAALPAGNYRCRTIKLGAQGAGGLAFVSYPAFDCRVTLAGTVVRFVRLNGSQRPNGTLFPASARQQVFLGALVLGDEARALGYGRDNDRNMAGSVQRIDPGRWRMVVPYPRFESTTDVIELVPAS